jgi:hypothetical protein
LSDNLQLNGFIARRLTDKCSSFFVEYHFRNYFFWPKTLKPQQRLRPENFYSSLIGINYMEIRSGVKISWLINILDPGVAKKLSSMSAAFLNNGFFSAQQDEKKIRQEIRDVIRQITASVTFLPLLDCICSFDILIYTHK